MEAWYPLLGFALICVGTYGIVEAFFDYRRCVESPSWPIAEGRIISSFVAGRDAGQEEYTEHLRFRYEFEVEGRRYVGKRIRAGQELDLTIGTRPASAWSTARANARRYPPGTPVSVRYDPRNPKRCCLETGGMPGIVAKVAFCIGLIAVGIALA